MDRGAWWATVHGIAKSQARLSQGKTCQQHLQQNQVNSTSGDSGKVVTQTLQQTAVIKSG